MDNIRLAEEKAAAERDHCQKADEKLAQANSTITELEAKLTGSSKGACCPAKARQKNTNQLRQLIQFL